MQTSAIEGTGLGDALDLVDQAARWRQLRVPRGRLNELFERATVPHPFLASFDLASPRLTSPRLASPELA